MVKIVKSCKCSGFGLACVWFLVALLAGGCEQPATPHRQAGAATNTAPALAVAEPGPGEKVCFACNGTGIVKCPAPGCVDGQVPCPGPCVKLSRGNWSHTDINGNYSPILWQVYKTPDGGTHAISEHHVGHVIVIQNGKQVDTGPCKICGGTGKVKCNICNGTGKVICPICNGKKFIPVAWTPTDNPYFNSQPEVIRLAGGQVILGRIAGEDNGEKIIVTRDKKVLHVKASDVLPKTEMNTNSPAAQTSPSI
jgi:hypothetical protein